ncbi:helix-turn-helix domain-containing protein [Pseudobutyrivibrio sp.]|uniref:helix-turn-helix domain-containing protein n=1 Tax=Pseudobutyrivibrio sp. TaxID=2014367 RepID=UPI00386772FE
MTSSTDWLSNEYDDKNDVQTHNHQNRELLFYRYVAEGNLEEIHKNIENHEFLNPKGIGKLSRDIVQNFKYHFVVSIALITRLCVDNGMEMERAYRLSDFYIQKLDDISTLEDLEKLHDKMVLDYTNKMIIINRSANLSRPMTECLNYIYSHLKERITVKDLAEYTSNSASYISRLFKDELGTSTSDYIRQAKIEASMNLLRYSDYSLADIANYFSFTSQSHFSQLFQKETGLTPKKYREKYYGTHWKGTPRDIMNTEE